jgi:hypothetical protein
MMHYPIKIWNHKHHGAICLGGHSHLKVNEFKERYMDVGVDRKFILSCKFRFYII